MRHHNANRKFGRKRNVRKALLKALAVGLISSGKIETSEPKAKELRPFIEKQTTNARKGTLSAYRLVISAVGPAAGKKLFTEIAPRYKERAGGYTRVTKAIARKGDGSPRAYIEFV